MEDHLRIGRVPVALVRLARGRHVRLGTLDRPWLSEPGTRWTRRARRWPSRSSSSTKLGIPYYCFHDRDVAPEGATSRVRANRRRARRRRAGYQERTGVRLLWGTANLFTHPRYQAGAATNPDPEVFAYAAAQVKHMLEVTQRLGGENYVLWGGREGYDTLLNTDLRREGEQFARFLHLVAEHKHKIGFEGQLLIEPKPKEPTKHQYDYDIATVHGFLVRHGLEGEYKVNIEANHATLAGHSFHHEVAYAAAHGHARQHRRQPRRPAERLGHRPVPELGRGPGRSRSTRSCGRRPRTGGFNFDAKLRRQSIDRTDLFHAHIGGIDTLARALLVAARLVEAASSRSARRPLRRLGRRSERRSSAARCPSRTSRRASPRGDRPAAASGRPGAAREPRQPAHLVGGPLTLDGLRHRDRHLDDRDEGGPHRCDGAVVGIGTAEYGYDVPRPLWSEQDPGLWWDGTVAAIRSSWPRPASPGEDVAAIGLTGQMHGLVLLDAGDGAAAGHPVERPADRPRLRRDPRGPGPERLIAITGNDALPGFTAPKLVWVRDHEPDVWARAPTCCCPRTTCASGSPASYALDKADGAGTLLFDLAARDWSPRCSTRCGIDPAWLPPTFEGPEVTGTVSAAAAGGDRTREPARRSSPAAATSRRTPSGVGAVAPGSWPCRWGRPAWCSRRRTSPLTDPRGQVHAFCHAVPDRWHLMTVMLSAPAACAGSATPLAPGEDFGDCWRPPRRSRRERRPVVPPLPHRRAQPHPDPLARGAFVGLTVAHDRRHLTRAVLEGVSRSACATASTR